MTVAYGFDYPVTPELQARVADVLTRRIHHSGPYTREAEHRIAEAFGCTHGVAVNSGSSACLLILRGLDIGPGDEVLIPATSYITPAEATVLCGARPIFVECEPDTLNMDVNAARAAISPRTRGIIVVHQYGHPVDLDGFADLCRSRGLFLVENCCHALGARYRERTVGSTGTAGFVALSRKHLSVCGTGGVAFTDDEQLATRMRMLGIHGRKDYESEQSHLIGYNMRFNEIQACIACYQLDMVDEWIAARQANAARYTHLLSRPGIPVKLPRPRDYAGHSYLHYVIRAEDRDELRAYLTEQGIGTSIHYRVACHLHPVFRELYGLSRGAFPVAETACDQIITLPATPNKTTEEIQQVAAAIAAYYNR